MWTKYPNHPDIIQLVLQEGPARFHAVIRPSLTASAEEQHEDEPNSVELQIEGTGKAAGIFAATYGPSEEVEQLKEMGAAMGAAFLYNQIAEKAVENNELAELQERVHTAEKFRSNVFGIVNEQLTTLFESVRLALHNPEMPTNQKLETLELLFRQSGGIIQSGAVRLTNGDPTTQVQPGPARKTM